MIYLKGVLLGSLLVFSHMCEGQMKYYISPQGNDSDLGTLGKPFASIARAKFAVRNSKITGKPKSVEVFLRGGTYHVNNTLVFNSKDGGDSLLSITYQAYKNEKVILSGGKKVTGWRLNSGNIWTASITDFPTPNIRQLYRSGLRMPRGRIPKKDSMFVISKVSADLKKITLSEPVLLPGLENRNAEVVILTNWNVIRIIIDSARGNEIYLKNPAALVGHCCCLAKPGMRIYIENAEEFVTEPGEWSIDTNKGRLLYMAEASENPVQENFSLPVLPIILELRGDSVRPLENLHFKNISIEYSSFPLPDSGYRGLQAGYYGYNYHSQPFFMEPTAINLSYTKHCSIENCKIAHAGASAIGIGKGCSANEIVSNEVFDIGGNGIVIGQRNRPLQNHFDDWPYPHEAPSDNLIYNNFIHDCGTTQFGDVGIFAAFCRNTNISHNSISDLPYSGISIGFIWDSVATSMKDCIVEYNDVHDVMKLLADGGAIYTLGWQPGSILRGNLLFNIHRSAYTYGGAQNNAIFFDECSRGFFVEDNMSYNVDGTSIRFNRNKPNDQYWGTNYFGVKPFKYRFLKLNAALAGSSLCKSFKKNKE